jgi:predicted nucleic acid-binding protein
MAANDIVVDASVVIKWYNDEPGREKALELRADHVSGAIRLSLRGSSRTRYATP